MSYSITINGHKDFTTDEERQAFEEGILAKARQFATELEGVSSASASLSQTGYVDVLAAS